MLPNLIAWTLGLLRAGLTSFDMSSAALEQPIVRISHCFWFSTSEHHLEVDRSQTGILISVNHACRCRDALPGTKSCGDAFARFVLNEYIEKALQNEEYFFDFVGVGSVALSRLDIHDGEREVSGGNESARTMLARSPGADEAMLSPLEPFDFRVLECRPIRFPISKPGDVAIVDFLERHVLKFFGSWMSGNSHFFLLS